MQDLKIYTFQSALNAHNLWKLFEVTSSILLSTAMTTTIIVNEHCSLTTSTILLINSVFMKVLIVLWMCLATAGGIPRDPAGSSPIVIQKRSRIAAHHHHVVATSSPILHEHKEEGKKKLHHQILQPSLALSLPILEIFAFDYLHDKMLSVAATILPSDKYIEYFQNNKEPAALDNLGIYNMAVTGASTSADLLCGLLGNNTEFILPSFVGGVLSYDYSSSTLLTMVES